MCTVGILLWTVWVQAQPLDEQEAQALREQVDQNEGLLVDLNMAASRNRHRAREPDRSEASSARAIHASQPAPGY